MAILINTNTPNILNGVSQQADDLRRASQGTEQINAISSLVDGLKKRPPFNNLTKIQDTGIITPTNSSFVLIDRDDTEKHLVDIQATVSVADLNITNLISPATGITLKNKDGDPLSVTDLEYLHTANPADDIISLVVDDYTFIVNKSVNVAMDAATSLNPTPNALYFVKNVRNGAVYKINLWLDATGAGAANYVGTYTATTTDDQQAVAVGLYNSLVGLGAGTYFNFSAANGEIHLIKHDLATFHTSIAVTVPEYFFVFKDATQSLSELPSLGNTGVLLEIENDANSSDDSYYVKYTANNSTTSGFTPGYWKETVAPGIQYKFDSNTMPHVLTSDGNNTFTFRPVNWDEMIAGDGDTNPQPSFVGAPIRGLLFYDNRLGFLAEENCIFSETGNYFNMFRTTVLQLLDTDPLDIGLTSSEISLLNHAIVNSEQLIVFSDKAQFNITHGADGLTPSSVASKRVTTYSNYTKCAPKALGNSIFFGYDKGDYSGVKEYFVGSDSTLFDAIDITDQCPRYIEGDMEKIVTIDSENLVVVKQSNDRNLLYGYKFYNQGDTRVLSAWFKLDLGLEDDAVINDIFRIGNLLYVVITRNDGTYIEHADMSSGLKDSNSTTVASLDRRITEDDLVSATYSAITNLTTLTLPYSISADITPAIVTRATALEDGGIQLDNVTRTTGTTLTIKGDYTSMSLWIGQLYCMEYIMTRPSIKQASDTGGSSTLFNGRLQVRYANLALDNTQYLKVEVTPKFRQTYNYIYTPRTLGTGATTIGELLTETDTVFRVPIYAKNTEFDIKLINNTPFQSNILGVNWEGTFQIRSRTT